MSQVICPLCGKFVSVRHYDPSGFEEDILLVQVQGLGRGKGVEIVEKYSLLNGENPELLDLISDRVAVIYDLLYEETEETEDNEEESDTRQHESLTELDELDKEILSAEEEYEDINDLDEDILE